MYLDQTHPRIHNIVFGVLSYFVLTVMLYANSKGSHMEPLENLVMGYQFGSPLPFVVEASRETQLYKWSTLAIQIVGVECDGKALLPFGSGIAINSFDDSTMTVSVKRATYLASASTLVSVREYHAATGEYDADGYTIPPQFRQLVITYRCRFPRGESERVYKLRINGAE